jgi:hypothetical protein
MDAQEIKPEVSRNASAAVIVPIAGMLGGLLAGVIRARVLGLRDLELLSCVIKWGATGFFAGLALVLLLALPYRRGAALTIRRLMVLVAVAGIIAWFFARVFFDAIGYGGF